MTWLDSLPQTRGKLIRNAELAPYTWFRVGGPADVLFLPEDHDDLAAFLKALDPGVPVTVLGVGSNTLVRDGGVEGAVVRLGRGFGGIKPLPGSGRMYAGAAALDASLAKQAASCGVGGLEFFRGVPGTVGGACVMNAGCYESETKDVLVEAYALDRQGNKVVLTNEDMGFSYRKSTAAAERWLAFTGAVFQGRQEDSELVQARMEEITSRREQTQPIREKTGGSTFKNPPGKKAWQLVDKAGWRGRPLGGAMFSELHANFLINTGEATAAELEALGETVRAEVKKKFGVALEWEIRRIGRVAAEAVGAAA